MLQAYKGQRHPKGQSKMNNPQVAIQRQRKIKNTRQYVLDNTICKQTNNVIRT